jgi:integrase
MPLALYQRKGVWHYRGTIGAAGKRRRLRGSCKTENKDIASRQIAEMEARYWQGHFDGPAAILTFAHAARLYRAAGKSVTFLEKIEGYLGDTLVKDITEGSVQLMAKELYPRCNGASLNRLVLVPTQAVINHCAKSRLCSPLKMERYKSEVKIKEPATLEWVDRFIEHAAPHLGAMTLFMYLTGARPSEATRLRWEDIDFKDQTALVRESKMSKERKVHLRKAHLPPRLATMIAKLPRIPGRGVFGYGRPPDAVSAWYAAIERAGIKPLTFHCCRHGFATGLLRRGVDVVTIAWLGGWKSPAHVLRTYGHANKNPRLTDLLLENLTPDGHTPGTENRNRLIELVKSS